MTITMQDRKTIHTIRGAGFGFVLASLIFVFTWSPWAILVIPTGAAMGFALSRLPGLERGVKRRAVGVPGGGRAWSFAVHYLGHRNLMVRFVGLLALGALLFLVAWTAGYYLLPEGVFRSAAAAGLEARGLDVAPGSVLEEWRGIFLANLIPVVVAVLGNLLLRVNGFPLGCIVPLFNMVGYGLFIGTNSFAIPYPERLAPTLEILSRAGPYEMAALALVAAATATWSLFEVRSIFQTSSERVAGAPGVKLRHVVFLGLGIALLASAAWIEASMIVATS